MSKKYLLFLILFITTIIGSKAQWVNSGPEWSGSSKIKQDGNRLYLYGSRLYKSDNNGNTWDILNTPSVTFKDLIFLSNRIIAATDKGMFVSIDNGINWISHNTGITDSANGFTAFGQLGNRIFVTAPSNVFYSDNNGQSWTGSSSSVGYGLSIGVTNGVIIVATNTGIKRSTDNGITYNTSNTGISGTNPVMISIYIFNNVIYCRKSSSVQINIYKSIDDGLNWQTSSTGINGAINSVSELMFTNSKLFFATAAGTFELNTGTGTWSASSLSSTIPYKILHYDAGKYFALNTVLDLYTTANNGISWSISQIDVFMQTINKLNTTINNKLFGIGNTQGAYLFNSLSSNWSRFTAFQYDFGGTTATIASTKVNCIEYGAGNKYYIGTEGGVWSSIDSGATWLQHHTGLPITNTTFSYKTVNDLYINGNVIIAATSLGIYRSTDQANTWTQVSTLNTADLHKYGSYLYATGNGVYRSNDNGLTWTAFAGATSGGPFSYITGAGGKIFTSTDPANILSNMLYADTLATSFTQSNFQPFRIFGHGDWLFMSNQALNTALGISSSNIIDISDNLPCYYNPFNMSCYEPYVQGNSVLGDNLWLGTSGFSTWYRSLGDFGFPVATTNIENENKEIKVYPNPTTNSFTIQNASSNSLVNIFNMQGAQVLNKKLTLNNENINLEQLSNGIYFYQITDNDGSILGKGKIIKN